ncbi:Helix-turn-helix domain-containing protein [Desulfotomaculum arcticum]|uniref:Helix-turn-helix domain-containing protein n=1 Tax=Desulfotruncus arcticus DSM 17038 TaxID=1121424 RepID=A0A1I2N6Z1_9FIRM|nr:helix-turn-helix domain-containing protein [Desulfotruncus arcticus]SFF97487.1 Helix-turn-helix domain-containing protein [Desulfotomaculum arcticum] [Desulfotruncus arcticus DSM 17038]
MKTLVILDPTLKKGFTSIPNKVLFSPGLSMPAKCLYAILLGFAWQEDECFPGQERLAQAAGCTDRTVRKYLDELKQCGLLSWVQRGLNQTNIYYIHDISQNKRLEPLGDKDRKERSGPDRKVCSTPDRKERSGQERNVLSDLRILSINNVVVEEPSVEKCREENKSEVVAVADQNNITELQQQAEKACSVHLPVELLNNLLAKYGIEKVREKIQMLGSVQTRNAPGFLIAALRDDYILQPGQIQQQPNRASPDKQAALKKAQVRGPDNPENKRKKELIKSLYMN